MNTRIDILNCVVASFLAGFFLMSAAGASGTEKRLPFEIRVIGGTDFACQLDDFGAVNCDIENGHYGTVRVSFPVDTEAEDPEQGILLEIRNINGRMGLRIEGAWLPSGTGEIIELPRLSGLAGSRLCVRDFPGADFEAPDSPCFTAPGQGRVDVPLGNGKLGFYLSDGQFRKVEYEPNRIKIFGLRNTAVMFDHNEPPIANDDNCRGYEDQRVICGVLANDVDLDGDLIRVAEVFQPMFGRAWIADYGIAYEPPPEWAGLDAFRYFVSDGRATALADVTVRVEPTNDPPVAVKDVVFVDEDGEGLFDLTLNDRDRDSATLSLTAVGEPEHGQATISGGLLRYVPPENWYGEDVFDYTVSDGQGGAATSQVKVLVRAINDTPVAKSASASTREDHAVSGRVTATDVDGDGLIYFLASRPTNGRIDFAEDGAWTYLPNLDYFGTDSFAFFVTDGSNVSNQAEVTIDVAFVEDNIAPASQADGNEDDQLSLHVFPHDYWNTCFSWMTDCDATSYYGPRMGDDLGIIQGLQLARNAGRDTETAARLAGHLDVGGAPDTETQISSADLIWELVKHFILRPLFGDWF